MPFDRDDLAQINADIDWLRKHPDKVPGPILQITDRYRKLRDAHEAACSVMVSLQQEVAQLRADNAALKDRLELPAKTDKPVVTDEVAAAAVAAAMETAPPTARSTEVRPDQAEADLDG